MVLPQGMGMLVDEIPILQYSGKEVSVHQVRFLQYLRHLETRSAATCLFCEPFGPLDPRPIHLLPRAGIARRPTGLEDIQVREIHHLRRGVHGVAWRVASAAI